MTADVLLIVHFLASLVMTIVIWFVQIVQYPLLAYVGEAEFPKYAAQYQRRIGWIVIGPMILEVVTAAALAILSPGLYRLPAWIFATVLLVVVWASTFLWQVRFHRKLLEGFSSETVMRLVRSNWLRTCAWTARTILVGWVLWQG